jgi:hypothetical protein
MIIDELFEAPQLCPECGGISFSNLILAEKKDACYHKVKASAKVWPSAYASGRLVQCRKKGAANYGNKSEGVAENAVPQLSVQQLATISDTALDAAYGYGRSTPGNTFGWQANLKSAAYAKQMIDQGVTDIEAISDAIHKGWNTTAQAFVQDPDQFDDTAKLAAAGKLQAKLQQRAQLMKQNYAQLPEEEKEKDRVVARALLQAMRGAQQPGMAEGYVPINISKMPTDPAPKPKKVEPKHKYVDNQADHEQYRQAREKVMYNVVGKFDRKVLNPEPIKGLTAAEEFMKQNGLSRANADLESISTLRFHATGVDASGKHVVSEPLLSMKDVRNFYNQHGINPVASTTDLTTTDDGSVTEGEQQPGADYRDPKEVDYDDEYDAMVARVKKLAGLGPLKTVYDPNRRVYKNVPTAVQPKK